MNILKSKTNTSSPYSFDKNKIPAEALKQDKYWRDRSAKVHEIVSMNRFHARNALNKLVVQHGVKALSTPLGAALAKRAR